MKTTKKKIQMKEAIGFSRYSVNVEEGKVFDKVTGKYKAANPNANGYCYVSVFNDVGVLERMGVHRLVYMAATGESIPDGMQVDHLDANKTNNSFSNLELVTHLENMERRKSRGEDFSKLSPDDVQWLYGKFATMNFYHGNKMDKFKILANELNVSVRAIQYRYKTFLEMSEAV